MSDYSSSLVDRFFRYVQIDTQSNPESATAAFNLKQLDLSRSSAGRIEEPGTDRNGTG